MAGRAGESSKNENRIKTEIAGFFLSAPRSVGLEKFSFKFNGTDKWIGVALDCSALYNGEKKPLGMLVKAKTDEEIVKK